jgi:predicted phosphoadenosine phosphosulfate sulfurtransferase
MKRKILDYIETWENRCYHEGIPDEAPQVLESLNKVPSYRKICTAIMKNDVTLESLGYTRRPCKSYIMLKRIEIDARPIKNKQLKLF